MNSESERVKEKLTASLEAHVKKKPYMPYLFLGSGISRRYLGLPDWKGLLKVFADEAKLDFDYLCATYEDLPQVADAIAEKFHDLWWNEPEYATLREKYRGKISDKRGALKAAVAEYVAAHDKLEPGVPGNDVPHLAEELSILAKASIDGVITTNYDSLCAQVFPQFRTFIGQQELLLGEAQFIAETYKIHGCVSDSNSLVLTAGDYREFETRNAYLAAKLLTIFAENPVLFVGYSLQDKYLNAILDDIVKAVDEEKLNVLGSRLYFIEWDPTPESEPFIEPSSLERGGHLLPITRIRTNSFHWVWEVLSELKRSFSGPLLRQLKSNLYDLVANASADSRRETVIALPLDSDEAENQKVVFGLGEFKDIDTTEPMTITSRTLQTKDILADVMGQAKQPMQSQAILGYGIPKHIRAKRNQFLPVWKYLDGEGRIDRGSAEVNFADLDPVIEDLAKNRIRLKKADLDRLIRESDNKLPAVEELLNAGHKNYFAVTSLLWLAEEGLGPEDFKQAALALWPNSENTERAKLACTYDRMMYSPHPLSESFEIF